MVMVRLNMSENLKEAITFVEQVISAFLTITRVNFHFHIELFKRATLEWVLML